MTFADVSRQRTIQQDSREVEVLTIHWGIETLPAGPTEGPTPKPRRANIFITNEYLESRTVINAKNAPT